MGLLSDPEYGSVKWVRILLKYHGPICLVSYIAALVWFCMLAHKDFNNDTYFSENALLPGLVTNEFNAEQSARKFFTEYTEELQDKYENDGEMPVPWLVAKMSQLHLEVYTHNYTLNYPLGEKQQFKGTNVYGILRAARTPSLEALVVTAPYRSPSTHHKGTGAGIALMLSFAQFARPQKYWAKDIIFLITEHEQLGMQAWLEAYHGLNSDAETFYTSLGGFWKPSTSSFEFGKLMAGYAWKSHKKCLNPGTLKGRSGSIQAAINLEFHTPKIKYIEVKVEGLNGQLPNLDLVNLVHKLCVKSGIHHSYRNCFSWMRSRNKMEEWTNSIKTLLGMVSTQLSGVPNGNHGLFHRFGIEAVTLEGRDANDPAGIPPKVNTLTPCNFYRLGVALESIMRSLNNLLERFHQSYFFYMLAGTNRFVSIGQYMPSLSLLCLAMLIRALTLWIKVQQEAENVADCKQVPGDNKTEKESESKETKTKKEKKKDTQTSISIVSIGANYMLVHVIGYAIMNSPIVLSQIGANYQLWPEQSIYYGLAIISVFLTIVTPLLPRWLRTGPITREELSLVNILLLVELATACLSVGMQNFALGLSIAIVYTPLALVVAVVDRSGGKISAVALFLKRLLCIILHPLSVVTICMTAYSAVLYSEESLPKMLDRGRDAAMQAIMFSVVDSMIYGNWLFNVVTSVMLPTWIIFWQILCNKVDF